MTDNMKSFADVLAGCNFQIDLKQLSKFKEATETAKIGMNETCKAVNEQLEKMCLNPPRTIKNQEYDPDVVALAQTTPFRYEDVLWVCKEYGDGYNALIQKHIKAGTTHEALYEMELELYVRRVEESQRNP